MTIGFFKYIHFVIVAKINLYFFGWSALKNQKLNSRGKVISTKLSMHKLMEINKFKVIVLSAGLWP